MKILMVLTSHDTLGNTGRKTGFWLEEFAAPCFVFRDAGVQLTLASLKGGQPPVDPFLVEDDLTRLGAIFEKLPNWQPFSIVEGRLITGQNPASSTVAAQNLLKLLATEKAA
jgi:putative intracellular protease/amidase